MPKLYLTLPRLKVPAKRSQHKLYMVRRLMCSVLFSVIFSASCSILLSPIITTAAVALPYLNMSNSQANNAKKSSVDQQQAIAKAKQSVQGKVLKIDRKKEHYRVKMLNPKGRVISVNVDRQSGKVSAKPTRRKPKPATTSKPTSPSNDKE